jgi:hypothetical protein
MIDISISDFNTFCVWFCSLFGFKMLIGQGDARYSLSRDVPKAEVKAST